MKYIFSLIWTEILFSLFASVGSGIFWVCKYLCSLMGICDAPVFLEFAAGAIGFWLLINVFGIYSVIKNLYKMHSDPEFKFYMDRGIVKDWNDYKSYKAYKKEQEFQDWLAQQKKDKT